MHKIKLKPQFQVNIFSVRLGIRRKLGHLDEMYVSAPSVHLRKT